MESELKLLKSKKLSTNPFMQTYTPNPFNKTPTLVL